MRGALTRRRFLKARRAAQETAALALANEVARARAERKHKSRQRSSDCASKRRPHARYEQAQREAEKAHGEAIIEARKAAERTAAQALESEVARLRNEADERLKAELESARQEAEHAPGTGTGAARG